jgi:hypothetical protein
VSKVNQTRDVQSIWFGINNNAQMVMAAGAATASSGTTLTTVTTAGAANCFAGQAVYVNSAANTATQATEYYGIIQSNTNGANTVLTVDGWTTLAGAGGSTPSSTTFYIIGPPPPFWYIALSDSTSAVAGTETGAAMGGTEQTTNGLSRALADTLTHTAGTTTAVVGKTFTYTGSSPQTLGRSAICSGRVSATNFAHFITAFASSATPSTNGDTVAVTDTITVG